MRGLSTDRNATLASGVGAAAVVLLSLAAGCSGGPTGPHVFDPDLEVLFVGNSLTAANDLPGVVGEIASADGAAWLVRARTRSNYSLEDHWNSGARDDIRDHGADVVVLQQGPSSLPANQVHLAHWSVRFAGVIREAGGEPALFMVWPSRARWHALDAVRSSYADAADSANAVLAPAGSVWGRLLEKDPEVPLTAGDGFHPGPLGSYAAALTIYGALADVEPSALPCPALLDDAARRELVCETVREVLASER